MNSSHMSAPSTVPPTVKRHLNKEKMKERRTGGGRKHHRLMNRKLSYPKIFRLDYKETWRFPQEGELRNCSSLSLLSQGLLWRHNGNEDSSGVLNQTCCWQTEQINILYVALTKSSRESVFSQNSALRETLEDKNLLPQEEPWIATEHTVPARTIILRGGVGTACLVPSERQAIRLALFMRQTVFRRNLASHSSWLTSQRHLTLVILLRLLVPVFPPETGANKST